MVSGAEQRASPLVLQAHTLVLFFTCLHVCSITVPSLNINGVCADSRLLHVALFDQERLWTGVCFLSLWIHVSFHQ